MGESFRQERSLLLKLVASVGDGSVLSRRCRGFGTRKRPTFALRLQAATDM
jgi:hypothetical protein